MPARSSTPADALALLADRFWETYLAANPTAATTFGDHRYDDRLEDHSAAGLAAQARDLRAILADLEALDLPGDAEASGDATPADDDWVTRVALADEISGQLAYLESGLETWTVDPLNGPLVALPNLLQVQAAETPPAAAAMVARWRMMGAYLDDEIANLRHGLADGRTATIEPVRKVLDQARAHEALPLEQDPLLGPLRDPRPDWSASDAERFADELTEAVRDVVRPAIGRYRELLETAIMPAARPSDRPGIGHLPGGAEMYRRAIRVHVTREMDPEEIHRIGLEEVKRIDSALAALGRRVLGTADLPATLHALRTDPALHFASATDILAVAEASLGRARDALPGWFGRLPLAACEVAAIPDHEAPHSTIAYYLWPAADSSRPGRFYVNTLEPGTRPRYEAEALAFHESIPGHHLQIALAQERADLPAFRRHLGSTAFAEGWGLYAERLADEMGLYSGDVDRFGILSYDAWRACRLVVDTGIHALDWTRDAAIAFMTAHTALARNNIVNEVDRYIVWPGQALGYKIGQLEILRLRALAAERLGDRFDIRAFHDAVLAEGAIGLDPLERIVERWIAETAAADA